MNAKIDKNSATIAFTLPVSCQICLGKVKEPVVCPNQHVFCGGCMDVWLQRNQQCPACRVTITKETPCRPVLGGLNPQLEKGENFSNRELRRARMELIYKDYENEIDRLDAEVEVLNFENKELRRRLKNRELAGTPGKGNRSPSATGGAPSSERDVHVITTLNNKLKDATALYAKVKADTQNMKLENATLRDQTVDQRRENERLRMEMSGRSPRKYGRFTVAALESKLETSERQVLQLQRALERSDSYIEGLEKELEQMKKGPLVNSKVKATYPHAEPSHRGQHEKKPMDDDDLDLDNTDVSSQLDELPSKISEISSVDRFEDSEDTFGAKSSFDLECPSPMTSRSVSKVRPSDVSDDCPAEEVDSLGLIHPVMSARKMTAEPTVNSCKKKLRFSGEEAFSHRRNAGGAPTVENNARPSISAAGVAPPTSLGANESLDISMTPEMEDCMRIMNEAERNVERRQGQVTSSRLGQSGGGLVYPPVTSTRSRIQAGGNDLLMSGPTTPLVSMTTSGGSHTDSGPWGEGVRLGSDGRAAVRLGTGGAMSYPLGQGTPSSAAFAGLSSATSFPSVTFSSAGSSSLTLFAQHGPSSLPSHPPFAASTGSRSYRDGFSAASAPMLVSATSAGSALGRSLSTTGAMLTGSSTSAVTTHHTAGSAAGPTARAAWTPFLSQ